MKDFAISDDPAVQAQLDRLGALSLPQGRFGLETIRTLLGRLGDPHKRLPPTFHVAGTNGKGSTCTFLRAMLEAEGLVIHSATKPHLVRYNERIRIAGKLIENAELALLLKQVLDIANDLSPSFFEVTTAATFLAFAQHPADACVIEVGLGGRFDATNVLERPVACGIAALGIDHEAFLLAPEEGTPAEPLARIAFEKASIAKRGVPLVTQVYPAGATAAVVETARHLGAELFMRDRTWQAQVTDIITYSDMLGILTLPLPNLPGTHQADNTALAVAMLRHQTAVRVAPQAMAQGIATARWPGRLQKLGPGPLTAMLSGKTVWIDGGHNADAAQAIARAMRPYAPLDLIFGLTRQRRIADVLGPLAPLARLIIAVPLPGHDHHDPHAIAAAAQSLGPGPCLTATTLHQALERLGNESAGSSDVLIAGSLYLAGEALKLNLELPD